MKIMALTFNPLLIASLDDFERRNEELAKAKGLEHYVIAKELCSLSSEIRFRLGPPNTVDKEVIDRIEEEFLEAANGIRVDEQGLDATQQNLLKQFRDNIRSRAKMIRDEAKNPMREWFPKRGASGVTKRAK